MHGIGCGGSTVVYSSFIAATIVCGDFVLGFCFLCSTLRPFYIVLQ